MAWQSSGEVGLPWCHYDANEWTEKKKKTMVNSIAASSTRTDSTNIEKEEIDYKTKKRKIYRSPCILFNKPRGAAWANNTPWNEVHQGSRASVDATRIWWTFVGGYMCFYGTHPRAMAACVGSGFMHEWKLQIKRVVHTRHQRERLGYTWCWCWWRAEIVRSAHVLQGVDHSLEHSISEHDG